MHMCQPSYHPHSGVPWTQKLKSLLLRNSELSRSRWGCFEDYFFVREANFRSGENVYNYVSVTDKIAACSVQVSLLWSVAHGSRGSYYCLSLFSGDAEAITVSHKLSVLSNDVFQTIQSFFSSQYFVRSCVIKIMLRIDHNYKTNQLVRNNTNSQTHSPSH